MNSKQILAEEIHQPARRNYKRRNVCMRGIDETWQADLVEMIPYAQQNKGYRYILTVIDNMSKYAWAIPLKKKTGLLVATAFKSIFSKGRVPKNLHVDRGREFYNKDCERLMSQYKINLYSTYSNLKASICERFNRTLKEKMWRYFSFNGSYKWIDVLPSLISEYNNTKHRTINMKPVDVNESNEFLVMERYSRIKSTPSIPKFKIGDEVRISKFKHAFEKGYMPNWTTEIFTIEKVVLTTPIVYKLKDYQNQPISGGFYEQELLKASITDVYLVEKVLKRNKNRIYVKWLGFDDTHNSWINRIDLQTK